MPTYPSSLYKGVARSANGTTNDPGSYLWNNLTTYQELKDTVIGYGSGPNDTTTVTFNSAAKYPTDVKFGVTGMGTSTFEDFDLAQANLTTLISSYATAVTSMTATEKEIAVAFSGISYNNLQSKMEKMAYEFNKLIADVALVNAGTAGGATTALGRYPSSRNRYTNTAGGL
jgi:hypothetical protein